MAGYETKWSNISFFKNNCYVTEEIKEVKFTVARSEVWSRDRVWQQYFKVKQPSCKSPSK